MCSNWALRSGCCPPSRVFFGAWRLYPSRRSSAATVRGPTLCLLSPSSFASLDVLFVVQRSDDSGSPRVTGSTIDSRSDRRVGSVSTSRLRPAPRRRIRWSCALSFGADSVKLASSRFPSHNRLLRIPVAAVTIAPPPGPNAIASAAAQRRVTRSSITECSIPNFRRICSTTSCMPPRTATHQRLFPSDIVLLPLFLRGPLGVPFNCPNAPVPLAWEEGGVGTGAAVRPTRACYTAASGQGSKTSCPRAGATAARRGASREQGPGAGADIAVLHLPTAKRFSPTRQ